MDIQYSYIPLLPWLVFSVDKHSGMQKCLPNCFLEGLEGLESPFTDFPSNCVSIDSTTEFREFITYSVVPEWSRNTVKK